MRHGPTAQAPAQPRPHRRDGGRARGRGGPGRALHPPARGRTRGERPLALQPLPHEGRDPRRRRRRGEREDRPVDVHGGRRPRLALGAPRLGRLLPRRPRRPPPHRPGPRPGPRPPPGRSAGRGRRLRRDGPRGLAAGPGHLHRRPHAVLHHRLRARLLRPRLRRRRVGLRPGRLPPPRPGPPPRGTPPEGRRRRLRHGPAGPARRAQAPVRDPRPAPPARPDTSAAAEA